MAHRSNDQYWESRGWAHYGPQRWERVRGEMDMSEFNRQVAEAEERARQEAEADDAERDS